MNSDGNVFKTFLDGFATIFKTNPTPLAIVAGLVVLACIAIYLARGLKGWQLVTVAAITLLLPCIVLVFIVGNDDPKYVLLKHLDGKKWSCLEKTTGATCKQPAGVTRIDATTEVVLRLHNENLATTDTYGEVKDGALRIIGNRPPDCSQPLPQTELRGDVSEDWKTIDWNNPTKWVRK
jgi:hypothetical protein